MLCAVFQRGSLVSFAAPASMLPALPNEFTMRQLHR
jgi:hypothetical protein